MTMFKTKEQIEEMAYRHATKEVDDSYSDFSTSDRYQSYIEGATQMQKELLESASKGFNDWIWGVNFGGTTQTEISRMKLAWEMATLSSKAQIETLKQRELEYQSDLREKDRIINDKSSQVIEMDKKLQEKDDEIRNLSVVLAKTSQYNKLAQNEIIELKKKLYN